MKYLLSVFCIAYCFLSFCQDTIVQTNSNMFGYDQTYILFDNGTFKYETFDHCTGSKSVGEGYYEKSRNKITFKFDKFRALNSAISCTNTFKSDSVKLVVYSCLDSNKLEDLIVRKDSSFNFLTPKKNTYLKCDTILIKHFSHHEFTIVADQECSEYLIYLKPIVSEIPEGEMHILKKSHKAYKRLLKIKESNYKAVFWFE